MAIRRFEDIQAWQEARKLVKMIYLLTDEGKFAKDFGLRDQIHRASVSIIANIAEGFDCDSQVEFARFLGIARHSAVEVQSLLYTALDVEYITKEDFKTYYAQTDKAKALTGLLGTRYFERRYQSHKLRGTWYLKHGTYTLLL